MSLTPLFCIVRRLCFLISGPNLKLVLFIIINNNHHITKDYILDMLYGRCQISLGTEICTTLLRALQKRAEPDLALSGTVFTLTQRCGTVQIFSKLAWGGDTGSLIFS